MAHGLDIETYKQQVSGVWRATLWLSIITVVEVAAALIWIWVLFPDGGGPRMLLNTFFIMASLLKAFFIVGEFMHMKYETRALALTVLVPTVFLIWFIIAFLWEGAEWMNNREMWDVIIEQGSAGHGHESGGHGGGH
ncbi:MAG: cytochrome C oxidase subunit IV family protein [Chitinophagales bacterium]